jgi:hypothetical protein
MSALIFALALLAQDAPVVTNAAPAPQPAATTMGSPRGAPRGDDYQLVAWCYGALRGYLDLHDEVMPEVTRIERTYRAPGSNLADDLKVYADQQVLGRKDLARFQAALTAAEKASMQPINARGAEAIRRGRMVWASGPEITKARKAQEWMSWSPPAACATTAETLVARSALMSPAFKANVEAPPSAVESEPAPATVAIAPIAPVTSPAPAAPADAMPAEPAPAVAEVAPAAEPSPSAEPERATAPVIVEDPPAASVEAAPAEASSDRPWTRRLKKRQEAIANGG